MPFEHNTFELESKINNSSLFKQLEIFIKIVECNSFSEGCETPGVDAFGCQSQFVQARGAGGCDLDQKDYTKYFADGVGKLSV